MRCADKLVRVQPGEEPGLSKERKEKYLFLSYVSLVMPGYKKITAEVPLFSACSQRSLPPGRECELWPM